SIFKEQNPAKQLDLRRFSTTADYYLASVNAITTDGKLVSADRTGSRVSAYPFAAKTLILVAGTQKITKDLNEAMTRVRDHVLPQEKVRALEAYGVDSEIGKWVIIEKEVARGRIKLILVKESLGF